MSSKEVIITIIAGFCAAIFIIVNVSYEPPVKKSPHTIQYILYSKDGLSGRFEWTDINWIGRYTGIKNFVRIIDQTQYSYTVESNVGAPFRISVEGLFDFKTSLKIFVDNKLIEELNGECFASEWLLSDNIGRSDYQCSRWTSGRTKHHVGYAGGR